MPDLLSQEELLALEEQLAGEEAPVAPPYVAAPGSPQVLPPGPSPEFLRRQAMMMPLRPGTGVAVGPEGIFTAVGAPPPSADMQMMEQLRGQINAMEFKNANDALNAAIQFQHMREAARLRERGTPEEQILQRLGRGLFYQQPNVIPSMMRETRPVPAPAVTNIGGVNVLRSGLRGERAQAITRSPTLEPKVSIKTDPLTGDDVITWSGSAAEFKKAFPNAKMPGAEEPQPNPKVPIPMPKTKAELKKGTLYATPRGLATWNGEKFIIQ